VFGIVVNNLRETNLFYLYLYSVEGIKKTIQYLLPEVPGMFRELPETLLKHFVMLRESQETLRKVPGKFREIPGNLAETFCNVPESQEPLRKVPGKFREIFRNLAENIL